MRRRESTGRPHPSAPAPVVPPPALVAAGAGGGRFGVPGARSGDAGAGSALVSRSTGDCPLRSPYPSNHRSSCRRAAVVAAGALPPPLRHVAVSPSSCLLQARPPLPPTPTCLRPGLPNHCLRLVTSVGRLHLSPSRAIVVPSVRLMTVRPGAGGGVAGMVPEATSPPSLSPGAIWFALPPTFLLRSVVHCCGAMAPGAVVLAIAPGPQ
jgi:hypothetical protein